MIHVIRWALIIAGIPFMRYLIREIKHPTGYLHRFTQYEFD